jgi:16S rRNA C967 or C1407 C5-methylase (RsmB/RsmF family)/NOL1/NOP2/fmu family ribosome biogenesis protein
MELPPLFLNALESLLGPESVSLAEALSRPPSLSVRLNPFKNAGFAPETPLNGSPVPWSSWGNYLKERPSFTFDPRLHAGAYYVQEASSMFVEQALSTALSHTDTAEPFVLDLCAAPGGKSTLAATCLRGKGLLVANEVIRTRAHILAENLTKWGSPNVIVTQSDASAFARLPHFFDVITTDVPCSGEGMFRKDPASIGEWSIDNVRLCAARQRKILENVWEALKPGGFLVYSTCTYNLAENEENVDWICQTLGGSLVEIPTQAAWGISGAQGPYAEREHFPVYRFFPHRVTGEGFFLALIRKDDAELRRTGATGKKPAKGAERRSKVDASLAAWLNEPADFECFLDRQGNPMAFPKAVLHGLQQLEPHLHLLRAGVALGTLKGKDLVPDASLALSLALNREAAPLAALDKTTALMYLRRETLVLDAEVPRGWVLAAYEGLPLGWMKNLGNRANNAYPSEWRIRAELPH